MDTPKSFVCVCVCVWCSLHLFLSLALFLCSLYILSLENYTITLDLVYKSISINQSLLKYPHTHAKCHTFKTTCKSALSFLFCTKYTAVSENCSCLVLSNSSVTPRTIAHQAPLSVGFSRQEYWRGLPFPFPGDLPNPGIELTSPALPVDSLLLSHQGSLKLTLILHSSLFFLVFSLSDSELDHAIALSSDKWVDVT